jgi:mono/diheme cytochrome c family protein
VLKSKYFLLFPSIILASVSLSIAAEQQHEHFHRTLPADQLEKIRALRNPLPQSPDTIAEGEKIYKGKGGCVNCHGQQGGGDGPMAADLDPPPRNFQHGQFWSHHAEGEIFWVIKHGAEGTAMPAYEETLTDDEIWAVMRFLPTFVKDGGGTHHSPSGHGHSKEHHSPEHGHKHGRHESQD